MTVEFFSLPRISISRGRKELLPALYVFRSILVPDTLTLVSGPEPLHTRRKSLSMMELSSLLRQRWGQRGRELVTRTKVLGEGRLDLRNRANFYLLKLGQQIAKFVSNFFLPKVSAYPTSVSFRSCTCTDSACRPGMGLQSRKLQFFLYSFLEMFYSYEAKTTYVCSSFHSHGSKPCTLTWPLFFFFFSLNNISLRLCHTSV